MQVKCDFYNYKFKTWEQYEIDVDMNLYPCCHIYTQKLRYGKIDDNFNHIDISLKTNTFENITTEYNKILTEDNWKDEKKCPPRCMEICQIT